MPMCAEYRFNTPLQEERVRMLKLGDTVYLDGEIVIMAGVPTFQRAIEYIERGDELPVKLKNTVIFHGASYNRKADDEYEILYLGPTTSTRFDLYTPTIIRECKVRAIVGKGGLSKENVEAMKEVGCVYLSVLGGGTPLLSPAIREVTSVNWLDLIPLFRLITVRVEGFGPAVVAIDAHGNSTYEKTKTEAEKKLPEILKKLSEGRGD
jgi:fumarate hydratase subunit beta